VREVLYNLFFPIGQALKSTMVAGEIRGTTRISGQQRHGQLTQVAWIHQDDDLKSWKKWQKTIYQYIFIFIFCLYLLICIFTITSCV
ncbi:MAG: hypothetical protein WBE61_04555, partial [Nitrososphaeraceae archaeon]